MSSFIPTLRAAFLNLSQQSHLRRFMETSPRAHRMTSRFIAGLHLEDALRIASELQARGVMSALDHLGENVATEAEASRAREQYLDALRRIAAQRLPATISVKLTALGLDLSEAMCRTNADVLVREAHSMGTRVEFDMEDSRYTDRILRIVRELHSNYGSVRAVLQAYLYRTEADVNDMCDRGIPVRLCKGAYQEPASISFPLKADVDRNYVKLMFMLLERGTYPAIATHDEAIIGQCVAFVRSRNILPERFEFEMLYGVRRQLQREVAARGHQLRLYVPYGEAWYPYFMRRLAERPANVMFLAKTLVSD